MKQIPLHFHFNEDIHIVQIQLFAKVVKSMMDDEFSMGNRHLVDCPLPLESSCFEELQAICSQYSTEPFFYISTPRYNGLQYIRQRNKQIATLDSNLHLAALQQRFETFKRNDVDIAYLDLADGLLASFVCINTALTFFYMIQADDDGNFSWTEKYGPCFFERERFSELRGRICWIAIEKRKKNGLTTQMRETARGILMSLMYQCGYLAFWSCLADMATFPGVSKEEGEVYEHLSRYLMKHYHNIYLYNLVVENNPVGGGSKVECRGSAENTTRIKLYFTKEDATPILIRFDLPHVEHPYVHLNIQDGENNYHVRLSVDVQGNEYDHVFDELAYALLQYNFNATDYVHSPLAEDKRVIRDMRYRTALMRYAPNAFYYQALGRMPEADSHPVVQQAKRVLVDLLEEDGVNRRDAEQLLPPDLLELACGELL